MGCTAWGWPSRGTGFSESREVHVVTTRPSAGLRRPSGSAEARECGALGDGAGMFSPYAIPEKEVRKTVS
jgi:hypothetical protein